jgi:hypothetical protein
MPQALMVAGLNVSILLFVVKLSSKGTPYLQLSSTVMQSKGFHQSRQCFDLGPLSCVFWVIYLSNY